MRHPFFLRPEKVYPILVCNNDHIIQHLQKENANNPAPSESVAYQPFSRASTPSYRNENAAIGDDTDAEVELP